MSFDIGVLEVLLPLLTGAHLRLLSREVARDATLLIEQIEKFPVTVLTATPATWRSLLDTGWSGKESLRLFSAGEALPFELSLKLLGKGAQLWNLYGPTETTVYSTLSRLDDSLAIVPIGQPIGNTQCFVLDETMSPVPIGVHGQLYIGGVGLARGYRDQPELTGQVFVGNPFGGNDGDRLYATGDLVRWRRSGQLEFLGRIDHQLKVRGFRIEPAEIEATLSEHSLVKQCVVIGREFGEGDMRLVAYIVPEEDPTDSAVNDERGKVDVLQKEQVSNWEAVWDEAFSEPPPSADATCNTAGVISSYTGKPIPADEARDWVDHAAKRVRSLAPDRVLDIGCGLGRTLFRVAPGCSKYWGVDFSKPALDYVKRHLHLLKDPPSDIRFLQASADQLGDVPDESFDVVILNGVVMYFPSMRYLMDVIERASALAVQGGHIFIGYIRSLPLLEAFHFSIALFNADEGMSPGKLREESRMNAIEEDELVVDPRFFDALKLHNTSISRVEVQLKRGWPLNELTKFRYDVVIRVGGCGPDEREYDSYHWTNDLMDLEKVRNILVDKEPAGLSISCVPNRRVLPELELLKVDDLDKCFRTVDEVKVAMETMRSEFEDPESFWQLSERYPYDVSVTWSNNGHAGYFDVRFLRRAFKAPVPSLSNAAELGPEEKSSFTFSRYGNNPLHAKMTRSLTPELTALAEKKLPHYMVPSNFVYLNDLPLTPSGKIDRKALPNPQPARVSVHSILPSSPLEIIIADVWKEVLQLETVGVRDTFFELGGHSLTAIQVVNRLKLRLKINISLVTFFGIPTIEQLANKLVEEGVVVS